MIRARVVGFDPFFREESRVLILGSFPSVKSRAEGFYYGNRQNRFWRTVSGFFGEETPRTVAEKQAFLLRRGIALWDVVTECDIVGSSDSSIENEVVADVPALLERTKITRVFCNGSKAYELLIRRFPALEGVAVKLPSTSPANPRFSERVWREALRTVFTEEENDVRGAT